MERDLDAVIKPANNLFAWNILPCPSPKLENDPNVSKSSKVTKIPLKLALRKSRKVDCVEYVPVQPVYPGEGESIFLYSGRFGSSTGTISTMSEEIPIIPKVNTIVVKTGNIVNWNRLKRKPNQSPTHEVSECISATVKKCLDSTDKTELQYMKELECVDKESNKSLPAEERGELKVIIKVFICSKHMRADSIQGVVEQTMLDLGVNYVETVLLSLSMHQTESDITVEQIKPFWLILENLVDDGRILSLGISDLDKVKLEELYQWAKVKPTIDQVNLVSCCVMPQGLTDYAKSVEIQLQTHNDPPELLPPHQIQEAIRSCGGQQDGFGWMALYVSRYSVLVKCRGIIKSKGYIVRALRDPNRRT